LTKHEVTLPTFASYLQGETFFLFSLKLGQKTIVFESLGCCDIFTITVINCVERYMLFEMKMFEERGERREESGERRAESGERRGERGE
jgi:hypothetical protein